VRLPGADSYAVDATDAGNRTVDVTVDPGSAHRVTPAPRPEPSR
jgi:hypothetical protein